MLTISCGVCPYTGASSYMFNSCPIFLYKPPCSQKKVSEKLKKQLLSRVTNGFWVVALVSLTLSFQHDCQYTFLQEMIAYQLVNDERGRRINGAGPESGLPSGCPFLLGMYLGGPQRGRSGQRVAGDNS